MAYLLGAILGAIFTYCLYQSELMIDEQKEDKYK